MKLLCDTVVHYRSAAHSSHSRAQKSTIALGQHPPNRENAELFLILFTTSNKMGARYKISTNVEKVFTKFMHEGKATISFKTPEHDLQIRCDSLQLKCFLKILKLGLDGKYDRNSLGLSSLAVTPIPLAAHPVTKLVIQSRAEYPSRGLPRTLKSLSINGIQRPKVDSSIFFLKNLTTLNLSDNVIQEIPKQFGQLRLVDVDLSLNQLGSDSSYQSRNWQWLDARILQDSLQNLNLANNQLKHFPYKLVKMKRLVVLNLSNNEINRIPFAVRRMKSLRFFHMAHNKLSSLPHTITLCNFSTLDVSNNEFAITASRHPNDDNTSRMLKQAAVSDLWELAARAVAAYKLPYSASTIPEFLMDMLEETPLCPCGRLSFSSQLYEKCHRLNIRSQHTITSNSSERLLGDSVFCSLRCFQKYTIR